MDTLEVSLSRYLRPFLLLVLPVSVLIPWNAVAGTLPPSFPTAMYYEDAEGFQNGTNLGPENARYELGTVSVIDLQYSSSEPVATGTTAVMFAPDGDLKPYISAASHSGNGISGVGMADITYEFMVSGPAGDQVLIDVDFNGSYSGPANGGSGGGLSIYYPFSKTSTLFLFNRSCTGNSCNLSIDSTILVPTNELWAVDLGGASRSLSSDRTEAQIVLDDTIAIDPANTVPDVSLLFSKALGPSTPEPKSLPLVLLGFACFGCTMLIRRKSTQPN